MKSASAFIAASAIILATAGTASAAAISFDGLCDGLIDIKIDGAQSLAVDDLKTGCGISTNAFEVGIEEDIPGSGKYITFAENTLEAEGYQGYAMYLAIQLPLRTGNHWFNAYTNDGKTIVTNSGTYTLGPPKAAPDGKKLPPHFAINPNQ
jgi:hypothetical protein